MSAEVKLTLDGIEYNNYEEYVAAKRRRNQIILQKSGLLEAKHILSKSIEKSKKANVTTGASQGIKRKEGSTPLPRRKSNRLAGKVADNIYIENETTKDIEISGDDGTKKVKIKNKDIEIEEKKRYDLKNNNGSTNRNAKYEKPSLQPKSLSNATIIDDDDDTISLVDDDDTISLVDDDDDVIPNDNNNNASSLPQAKDDNNKTNANSNNNVKNNNRNNYKSTLKKINKLQITNKKHAIKAVPEAIHSVCFHPSKSKLLGCAGDKIGNIGLWNINNNPSIENNNDNENNSIDNNDNVNVTLFKPHSGAVTSLQWNTKGTSLYSLSSDSTIKQFDMATEMFKTIFSTYSINGEYKDNYYTMNDIGGWLQYGCLDTQEQGYYLSTSHGDVLHLDFRTDTSKPTFHYKLDKKQINTISLHTNGYNILTAGLSRKLQLFDLRSLNNNAQNRPIASHTFSKSINSAYFSPSGSYVVTTTMSDTIDIYNDFHLKKSHLISPDYRIVHDNTTGKGIVSFEATWHPNEDVFVVGSQRKRGIEIFNVNGSVVKCVKGDNVLDGVISRCCFHPRLDDIMCLGGNSIGKMFLFKK